MEETPVSLRRYGSWRDSCSGGFYEAHHESRNRDSAGLRPGGRVGACQSGRAYYGWPSMAAAAAYSLSGAILCAAAALLCLWAVCVPAPDSLSALLLGTAALLAATLLLVTMEGRGRSASAPLHGQLELRFKFAGQCLLRSTAAIRRGISILVLKQRCQPDLELVAGEAVQRDVAVLFGKDIGKAWREAVIVEPPVEQGESQHRGIVAAAPAKGGQSVIVAGDEIGRLDAGGKAKRKVLAIGGAEPDTSIGIGREPGILPIEAQLQLKQAGRR